MTQTITIIGGGPAGLIAAQRLAEAGRRVTVYDRMPTVGRKFLMAGRGGLNLTHSEPLEAFLARYGAAQARLQPLVEAFTPADLIAWAQGLGQETHVGSSGRVFPTSHKASPLLRAWLRRLQAQGVQVRARHDWLGWDADGGLRFRTPEGEIAVNADATVLALGGASWPKLGATAKPHAATPWSPAKAWKAARSTRSPPLCATPSPLPDRPCWTSTCALTRASASSRPAWPSRVAASR